MGGSTGPHKIINEVAHLHGKPSSKIINAFATAIGEYSMT